MKEMQEGEEAECTDTSRCALLDSSFSSIDKRLQGRSQPLLRLLMLPEEDEDTAYNSQAAMR